MTLSVPHEVEAPDSKTCWNLLERVAASSQLKRAARLRELLLFVGRRSLIDGCAQVREQEIGIGFWADPKTMTLPWTRLSARISASCAGELRPTSKGKVCMKP